MKPVFLLFVLAAASYAQDREQGLPAPSASLMNANVIQHNLPVTRSDLYCAGFLGKQLPRDRFVAGGLDTPYTARFVDHDFVFLRGNNFQPGTRVSFVRDMRDTNALHPFPGTASLLGHSGHLYSELGYGVILENRGTDIAVARIEFSCDNVVAGDLVVPFVEKQPITVRPTSTLDRFPAHPSALSGRIVAAGDFDQNFGVGHKIYLNVGADRGVKPGDYFRLVRSYARSQYDEADAGVFDSTIMEDTQRDPLRVPYSKLRELPSRVVGEAIVLSTQPGTATAMITFALQEVHVGDYAELEEAEPH